MNVLIACEESQEVCKAFRKRGHRAFSCDIEPCSGGHEEWHIQGDVLPYLNGNCDFTTAYGTKHHQQGKWDLIIAHPPCTYLTVTGNRWFNVERYGETAVQRIKDRELAVEFFMVFVNADCDRIAIENPIGCMSTKYRKPDQVIEPYWFGDPYEKKTCLWLKGLNKLIPTEWVQPAERVKFGSGKSMPKWYADAWKLPAKERAKIRSKTFHGIAEAMATQWTQQYYIQMSLDI